MSIFIKHLRNFFIVAFMCISTIAFAIIDISEITPASASDKCDGSIRVIAQGATETYAGPFKVVLVGSNPQFIRVIDGTVTIPNLCPGQYQVEVTDAFGCKKTFTPTVGINCRVTLNEPTIIPSCTPGGGAITVTPQGGTAPFTYPIALVCPHRVRTWSPARAGGKHKLTLVDEKGSRLEQRFEIIKK